MSNPTYIRKYIKVKGKTRESGKIMVQMNVVEIIHTREEAMGMNQGCGAQRQENGASRFKRAHSWFPDLSFLFGLLDSA